MWIENIDLDDFGCFNRARLQGIDDGLTVIAGPQRAGKSTFMNALRHLGYGIPRGASVPPAAGQYDVTADVVFDGHRYRLSIDGYSDPVVTSLGRGPDRTAGELFGDLPSTQYQQLYTVSLDELRRDPDTLEDGADLSSVLFTAAYGDTDVPDVRDALAARAESIGGVKGSDSYELREPVETIEDGVAARDDALEQVEEYERRSEQKETVDERIEAIRAEREELRDERTRVDAILDNHETYTALESVEAAIDEKDADLEDVESFPADRLERARMLNEASEDVAQSLDDARQEFRTTLDGDVEDSRAYRERLLANGDAIQTYETELSRWREQVSTLRETARELDQRRDELEGAVSTLISDWDALDDVRNQAIDTFATGDVRSTTERVEALRSDVDEVEDEIGQLGTQREELESRIQTASQRADGVSIRPHLPFATAGVAAAVVLGAGVALTGNPLAGVAVTTISLMATGLSLFSKIDAETPTDDGVAIDALSARREDVESQLESACNSREAKRAELEDAETDLDAVKAEYDISRGVDPSTVWEFYENLVDVHEDVSRYDSARAQYRAEREAVEDTLRNVSETLAVIGGVDDGEVSLENADRIFATIERVIEQYGKAKTVEEAARGVLDVEADVAELLAEWNDIDDYQAGDDGIRDALERFRSHGERVEAARERRVERDRLRRELRTSLSRESVASALEESRDTVDAADGEGTDDEGTIAAFETILTEYGGIDGAEARRDAIDSEIEALHAELEERRDERADLKQALRALASDEDIRTAHATIEAGQRELEPRLEAYAKNRIGEYLLDELHERFVDRTTGPLLEEASDVFERITGGAYTELDSYDEFDDLDFQGILADGTVRRTAELSRATAEQLFLAVRIARIKRHDEPLPVLLDDSLTNFDPGHVDRTLDVLSELADETQLFILTCHPSLLDHVEANHDASYWSLDDSHFAGPHDTAEPLRDVLAENATSSTTTEPRHD